jgi:hypothetical protein
MLTPTPSLVITACASGSNESLGACSGDYMQVMVANVGGAAQTYALGGGTTAVLYYPTNAANWISSVLGSGSLKINSFSPQNGATVSGSFSGKFSGIYDTKVTTVTAGQFSCSSLLVPQQ